MGKKDSDGGEGGHDGEEVGVEAEVDGSGSVVIRKVSPAPSQSELVMIGVCICTYSFR